jgi:MFS family permease
MRDTLVKMASATLTDAPLRFVKQASTEIAGGVGGALLGPIGSAVSGSIFTPHKKHRLHAAAYTGIGSVSGATLGGAAAALLTAMSSGKRSTASLAAHLGAVIGAAAGGAVGGRLHDKSFKRKK